MKRQAPRSDGRNDASHPARMLAAVSPEDRAEALRLVPVSRETEHRLAVFVDLVVRWQRVKNLIAPSTLGHVWTRHVADSAQLVDLVPRARKWIDLGSGAGFPGLVIAIRLTGASDAFVHLIESDTRKAAFLREAVRATGACAVVHAGRIEHVLPDITKSVDAVSARALAPLPHLLELSKMHLLQGAIGVFPKGQDVGRELTQATKCSKFYFQLAPSVTNVDSRIVLVSASGRRLEATSEIIVGERHRAC